MFLRSDKFPKRLVFLCLRDGQRRSSHGILPAENDVRRATFNPHERAKVGTRWLQFRELDLWQELEPAGAQKKTPPALMPAGVVSFLRLVIRAAGSSRHYVGADPIFRLPQRRWLASCRPSRNGGCAPRNTAKRGVRPWKTNRAGLPKNQSTRSGTGQTARRASLKLRRKFKKKTGRTHLAQKRKRTKRNKPFEELLAEEAIKFKEAAAGQPAGSIARERLLRRARQAETASHINSWLCSPGLQPPKAVANLLADQKSKSSP